ncbi:MAG: UdgX family uracil-DNA binding protein [Phycisphaeraceae bacterium]
MGEREQISAADFLPEAERLTLRKLRDAASRCKGCELYKSGTQTVFGEGPRDAKLMLVGEQPGDQEDRKGRPFVGAAGELLRRTLGEAGVDPARVYITNVVKHFRYDWEGGRRHSLKPLQTHIHACLPWLEQEVALVKPVALVCLGAVAAQTLIDKKFKITQQRGEVFETQWSSWTMATIHPAALLRIPDDDERAAAIERLRGDLKKAAQHIAERGR